MKHVFFSNFLFRKKRTYGVAFVRRVSGVRCIQQQYTLQRCCAAVRKRGIAPVLTARRTMGGTRTRTGADMISFSFVFSSFPPALTHE